MSPHRSRNEPEFNRNTVLGQQQVDRDAVKAPLHTCLPPPPLFTIQHSWFSYQPEFDYSNMVQEVIFE